MAGKPRFGRSLSLPYEFASQGKAGRLTYWKKRNFRWRVPRQSEMLETRATQNMENNNQPPISKRALWVGYILSALPVLLLVFSAVMKLMKPPQVVEGFAHFGIPEDLISKLGILELVCTVVYLIPQTSVLGAILITGYFGGATATNLRVGEPFIAPVIAGVLVWGGLYLRHQRVRALFPMRMM
jgi:hypothetical protein